MVQYASGSIKFSGLGSDTDWQDVINKLYSIESRHANQLLKWKEDWQQRLEAFRLIRTEMLNMQTALSSINSVNKFLVKTAASSNDKVATAVAGADALNGTYTLEVNSLASQYSWSMNTNLFDKNDVICTDPGGGTFQYSYQGAQRTLHIPPGTTLEGLKNTINNDSLNRGVRAQLITTQTGIVFQLNSKDTGSANTLILQNTDNILPFGPMSFSSQKYDEQPGRVSLTTPFSSMTDFINSTGSTQTFVFTIDGKKASIAVPDGATIQDLVDDINAWGAANVPSHNGEPIASLTGTGPYTFTLAKRDSVYGAGTYSDDLLNALTTSYASAGDPIAAGAAGDYDFEIIGPTGAPMTVSTGAFGGGTLSALRNFLQGEADAVTSGMGVSTTVSIIDDPANPGKVKLSFGPVVNDTLRGIMTNPYGAVTDVVDTSSGPLQIQLTLTNSDLPGQAGDTMTINIPQNAPLTIGQLCDTLNQGLGRRGTAKLVSIGGGQFEMVIETKSAGHSVTVNKGTLSSMSYELPVNSSGWLAVEGVNAEIRVNGWPAPPEYVESASNSIAAGDIIEGLSLTLRSVGSTVITVANDMQKIADNVTTFVSAVNSFRTLLQSLTQVTEDKKTLDPGYSDSLFEMQKGSILTGNYGVQLISSRMKSAVAQAALGFVRQSKDPLTGYVSGDVFSSLAEIGITTNASQGNANYGLLDINTIPGLHGLRTLEEALTQNAEAVAKYFSTAGEGVSNTPHLFQYSSHLMGVAQPGTYDVQYAIDSAGDIISASINGKAASIDNSNRQITLLAPAGDPARSIALNIYDLNTGTHQGSVSIKEGKVNELLSMMNGSEGMLGTNGTLANLEKNYQTIIDNIDKKIEQEDARLSKWQRTMNMKFSRLETLLGTYNRLNEGLKSQITQLNKSDN
ncbi:MAG: flagellar filament capping protein FliD [Desulfovibrio sp.]|jgi:flagellar hook-associated protein 2|nr:flagellar filament capping protein FliD [Desulfovibrio sp.]